MTRAYISAKLADDPEIRDLRDEVYDSIRGRHYYRKKDPHITVIPPFHIAEGHEDDVEELVESLPLTGREVTVRGLAVWENIDNPYVVMLDVNVEIQDVREMLLENLEDYTVGQITQPVNPHITLFKTERALNGSSETVKQSIQEQIIQRNSWSNTEVEYVDVEFAARD